ncbi:hypothetical protein BC830DRAFT_892476 [Chytriomyces sp. MP71]|nr:hypothetical protein BC830DRAFT_892476 [Chytriomyces sp. MP71]
MRVAAHASVTLPILVSSVVAQGSPASIALAASSGLAAFNLLPKCLQACYNATLPLTPESFTTMCVNSQYNTENMLNMQMCSMACPTPTDIVAAAMVQNSTVAVSNGCGAALMANSTLAISLGVSGFNALPTCLKACYNVTSSTAITTSTFTNLCLQSFMSETKGMTASNCSNTCMSGSTDMKAMMGVGVDIGKFGIGCQAALTSGSTFLQIVLSQIQSSLPPCVIQCLNGNSSTVVTVGALTNYCKIAQNPMAGQTALLPCLTKNCSPSMLANLTQEMGTPSASSTLSMSSSSETSNNPLTELCANLLASAGNSTLLSNNVLSTSTSMVSTSVVSSTVVSTTSKSTAFRSYNQMSKGITAMVLYLFF